jgi:quinol monooxygenase YgiN
MVIGEGMRIGGLKTILVKEGHETEFEILFGELRAAIQDGEPDCLYYSLLKSRAKPRAYIVEEQYRDQAAFDRHQSSQCGKVYFPKIRAILESIEVEYFDVVVP